MQINQNGAAPTATNNNPAPAVNEPATQQVDNPKPNEAIPVPNDNVQSPAVMEQKGSELILHQAPSSNGLMSIDLNLESIPDLDDATVLPIDLVSRYWSPDTKGDVKRMYFDKIEVRKVSEKENPEVLQDLAVAFFYEKVQGQVNTVCNASKRLIAVIENQSIMRGTPLQITYLGKRKNSTNEFKSDDWDVKPLILKK